MTQPIKMMRDPAYKKKVRIALAKWISAAIAAFAYPLYRIFV